MDPENAGADPVDPQSWNGYAYVINNPLVLVDPLGLSWVRNSDGTIEWTDECGNRPSCYDALAVGSSNEGITIYGSISDEDVTTYAANEYKVVNVSEITKHHDAQYVSIQTPGKEEDYLSAEVGAALFNVAHLYSVKYQGSAKLVFKGGSTSTGGFATKTRAGHTGGLHIDLGYVGEGGKQLRGLTSSADANVERMQFIFKAFKEQNAGLGAPLTGHQERFELRRIKRSLERRHRNHLHFQAKYH